MSDLPRKQLPGHIAAALAGAGGVVDSAGQPWAGRELPESEKYHNFDGDDGATDPLYQAAVEGLLSGDGSEAQVVASLAQSRVFIPIVAQLAEKSEGVNGLVADKESDMALVTLQAPDGRRALPAFTNAAALASWHPQARPVAVYAARAALSAVSEEAQILVLDPGSERPFVVRRPAVWTLARQQPWLPSYLDPAVAQVLADSMADAENPAIVGISASPGKGIEALWDTRTEPSGRLVVGGGAGPELSVTLVLQPGLDQPAVNGILNGLQAFWARNEHFAEAVDSVHVRLRHPSQTA